MNKRSILVAIVVFIVFSWSSYWNAFSFFENYLQDSLFQERKDVDQRIAILAIDEESQTAFGKWPWPRSYSAELLNRLTEGKPAVIGMDIIFAGKSDSPEEDAALAEAAKNAGNVVIAGYMKLPESAFRGHIIALDYIRPYDDLAQTANVGCINVIQDQDNIVRSFPTQITFDGKPYDSFDLVLYDVYQRVTGQKAVRPKIPVDYWDRAYIDFNTWANDYEVIPVSSVLTGDIPPEYFKDRIVLIGPFAEGMMDSFHTSILRKKPMYGVEIHANIIQNLLMGKFKTKVTDFSNQLILLIIFIMSFWVFKRFKPFMSLCYTAAIIFLYMILAKLLYNKGYILSLVYPLMLVSALYIIILGYRYIEELVEKKRVTNIFGRYVAPQVVNQILQGGKESLKLGGTRKEITALFVDIRGFTPMSEKVEPEEVVGILNNYLDLCSRSIFQYGGTLDKFIGDATMAIFNAPLDLEDHAFRAVQTAWAMKQGSIELQKDLELKYGRSVQFGIGINTGPAVVGNIGSKSRMDYTAIGDTVNTAARLESNAKPGQILISQATYDLVKDKVQATSLGEISVKGKTQGIQIYQLEGVDL